MLRCYLCHLGQLNPLCHPSVVYITRPIHVYMKGTEVEDRNNSNISVRFYMSVSRRTSNYVAQICVHL